MRPKVLCGSKCSTALQLPRRATTSTARGTHCTHSIMVIKATTGAAVDSGSIYCLAHILARDTTTWILHTVSTKRIARRRHAMGIFDYAFGRTTLVPYTPLPYYYGTPSRRPVAAAVTHYDSVPCRCLLDQPQMPFCEGTPTRPLLNVNNIYY